MSKTLYEEAIADAKQLRELAEDSAKNRVIEAVMPQIRDLVNRRILGEQIEDGAAALGLEDETELNSTEEDLPGIDAGDESSSSGSVINVTAQGDVNIEVESEEPEGDEEDVVLTDTMAEALGRLIRGDVVVENSIEEKLALLESRVTKLKMINDYVFEGDLSTSQKSRLNLSFIHCLREALNLRGKVILNEHDTQDKLERRLSAIIKEMKQMSKSNRRNIFDFLFEEEDKEKMSELEEAELSLELEDEELDSLAGAEDVDAVDAALADILGDVEVALGDGGGEEAAEEEEGEELEMGAEEEELAADEEAGEDEVLEIDEGMLRREIHRMRRLREQEEGRAAEADPYLAHDGEEVGDVVLDVDEDDLINALADELGDSEHTPPAPGASGTVAEMRRRRARRSRSQRVNETRQVKQYRTAVAGLKKQLVEMNLFNAKLLYANKLMQNKNLTTKQQRAIVEALDNAKTLREAKLLYKSLSESLTRRARGKKLNEGSLRTLGSSSRSTRSAQPASNGVEVDRWGVLAGLTGKD